uniref:Uncharacterized protein n=1 Tax=Candidatus Kentrum sp. DK TaxID=2126562 RepID=A0A450SG50_9GAMM|nr:MAG: hypothetical protein BECKDK2373B_GA0170837_103513 [Candidatus Kentron sp. DK]
MMGLIIPGNESVLRRVDKLRASTIFFSVDARSLSTLRARS